MTSIVGSKACWRSAIHMRVPFVICLSFLAACEASADQVLHCGSVKVLVKGPPQAFSEIIMPAEDGIQTFVIRSQSGAHYEGIEQSWKNKEESSARVYIDRLEGSLRL